MAHLDEQGLQAQIKQKQYDRLYYIYGAEDFLKKHYVSTLTRKLVQPDFEAFNSHTLEGREVTLDAISDCVSSMPFMSEHTCTVVRDMPLNEYMPRPKNTKNAQGGDDGGEEDGQASSGKYEQLCELLEDIPESSVLIFWMDTVEPDPKSGTWIKVLKTFEKYGTVAELGQRSRAALIKLLCDSAAKKGCTMDRDAAAYMIERAGDDLGNLKNEIDKLCAYLNGKPVTKKAIDQSVIASLEANIFSLSKAICAGRADEAFDTLGTLFKLREEPVKILAILSGSYVDMYRAKAALLSGVKNEELISIYKSAYAKKEFLIRNAASAAAKYSIEKLRTALELLGDADTAMKTTRADGTLILERLVLELMRL